MLTHDAKDDDPPLLWPSSETRRQLGDISSVTLWRRVNDKALDFPKPIKIAGRNYFVPPEIVAWLKRQAGDREAPRDSKATALGIDATDHSNRNEAN